MGKVNWWEMKEINEAIEKARDFLKRYQDKKLFGSDIDLDEAIELIEKERKIDIKVSLQDFDEISKNSDNKLIKRAGGYIYTNGPDNPVKIVLNSRKDKVTRRFVLTHELGHLLMGHVDPAKEKLMISWNVECDLSRMKDAELIEKTLDENREYFAPVIEEYAANAFACELLMPKAEFEKILRFFDLIDDAEEIANYFNVTIDAVYARAKNLNERIS